MQNSVNANIRGNCKTLILTAFRAQRDGFIAQAQRGHHSSLSLFALACGVLAVGR